MVPSARPRLRQHDPGGIGDPHRLLRRDGDRGVHRRPGGRPRPPAVAAVRAAGDRPGRRRHRDAADVPAHQRGLSRHLPVARGVAAGARARAHGARGPGARARDRADGCDAPDADSFPDAGRQPEPGVRAALRGEHDRGDHRHAAGGPGAHRAPWVERGARGRGGLLSGRRARRAVARARGARPGGRDGRAGARRCRFARRRRATRGRARARDDTPHAPRTDDRVRVGADLARLPGPLDADAGLRDGQHDVRVHDHPRALPGRPGHRRAAVQSHPSEHRQPDATARRLPRSWPARSCCSG